MENNAEEFKKALDGALEDVLLKGKTLGSLAGMTEDEMESLYTIGYAFYARERFDQAVDIFHFICMHHHIEPRYWLAYGTTLLMLKRYPEALHAFSSAAVMDQKNPLPSFYAGMCFLDMGRPQDAAKAFDAALFISEGKKEHKDIHKKSKFYLDQINKKDD